MAIALLFGVFLLLLLLGLPVAFSLLAASLATLLYLDLPLIVLAQQTIAGAGSATLIAIPLFIFAGELMLRGGLSERLIGLARVESLEMEDEEGIEPGEEITLPEGPSE